AIHRVVRTELLLPLWKRRQPAAHRPVPQARLHHVRRCPALLGQTAAAASRSQPVEQQQQPEQQLFPI
ncbi:hypothetical protein LPJ53_006330, partial [Coemansia erecta]